MVKTMEKFITVLDKVRKETEHIYNGPALFNMLLDLYTDAFENGDDYSAEALEELAQEHTADMDPYHYQKLKMFEQHGYLNTLELLEVTFGARIWSHISPTDFNAVHDTATSLELSHNYNYLYELVADAYHKYLTE